MLKPPKLVKLTRQLFSLVAIESLARYMNEHYIVSNKEILLNYCFPKAFAPLRRVHSSPTDREGLCTPRYLKVTLQILHPCRVNTEWKFTRYC